MSNRINKLLKEVEELRAELVESSWRPITAAPKDNGQTRLLAKGRYIHPFNPSDKREAYAEVYYNKSLQRWIDRQGHYFLPTDWLPISAVEAWKVKQ